MIPFDVHAGEQPAEWFRILSAPGTSAIRVQSRGTVQAWLDGLPMTAVGDGRFTATKPPSAAAVVALRVIPEVGCPGGSAIPEPIQVETSGDGILALGELNDKLEKVVVAFLNSEKGGDIYIGVDDSGRVIGALSLTGVEVCRSHGEGRCGHIRHQRRLKLTERAVWLCNVCLLQPICTNAGANGTH